MAAVIPDVVNLKDIENHGKVVNRASGKEIS
jgi:hypothetical protein